MEFVDDQRFDERNEIVKKKKKNGKINMQKICQRPCKWETNNIAFNLQLRKETNENFWEWK